MARQWTHLLLYSNLLLQLAGFGLVSSCLLVTQLLLQNLWVISLPHAGGPRPVLQADAEINQILIPNPVSDN